MKCSKCHRDATKKIQLEGGVLPCCDSYDCNLLLRVEIIKPQINNAMKSLFLIPLIFILNCNVANDKSDPCDTLITEVNEGGGIERYLVCGKVNQIEEGFFFTDLTYYSWAFELIQPDTLYAAPLFNETTQYTLKNIDNYILIWVNYHDEAFTYVMAR